MDIMKIEILKEAGYEEALLGLGLSYGLTDGITDITLDKDVFNKVINASEKLYNKEGGHNKFLESMIVWLDVTAPRFWWSEADTYRLGTKQSASTMHTMMKTPFTMDMFEYEIPDELLNTLEFHRKINDFMSLKNILPEGFLQRRIWVVNYKTLRNIIHQRKNHKLEQWKYFCRFVMANVNFPEYFQDFLDK
jgi:hypothetical protein